MAKTKYDASDAVRREWLRRVEAEYTSAVVTQHLTLWLMQIGASPDLVHAGLRIAADEMVHARLSHVAYRAAGGEKGPQLARERLGLRRTGAEALERDVMRCAMNTFCLGETVAVPLFKKLRDKCTVVPARRCLDRVLRDEVRHRDFGWALAGWLLEQPGSAELRALATRELPGWFAKLHAAYGASMRHVATMPDDDRAWGLMSPAEYLATVERALGRDWIPRFAKLGIDAKAAWEKAHLPVESAERHRRSLN
jgi:hypothetical protein